MGAVGACLQPDRGSEALFWKGSEQSWVELCLWVQRGSGRGRPECQAQAEPPWPPRDAEAERALHGAAGGARGREAL